MNEPPTTLNERIQAQAEGYYPAEAAAIIITEAVRGTLPDKISPAITDHPDIGRAAIDWDLALRISEPFSSGERRLLALAASLATDHHRINAGDTLSGLDETNGRVVLQAVAHCLRVDR